MAQATQNANALAFLRDITDFAQQLKTVLAAAQSIQARQATHNYAANLQAMPTYAMNADGTALAVDATPQQGNPIVGVNLSFYSTDIFRSTVIDDMVKMLTGSGDVAASDRRPRIDALLP